MTIDEFTVCDDFRLESSELETRDANGPQTDEKQHPGAGGQENTDRKQPIGAASTHSRAQAAHLATFVGCTNGVSPHSSAKSAQNEDNTGDVNSSLSSGGPLNGATITNTTTNNNSRKNSAKAASNQRDSLTSNQNQPSQARINHSLESINSRYSNSSANDDYSAISMQQNSQPQPSHLQSSLRHRLSTSQASNCSPIEAQLASSTCDLGIGLVDAGTWRASFSAASNITPGSPTKEPAKSLAAIMSLTDRGAPDEPKRADSLTCKNGRRDSDLSAKQQPDKSDLTDALKPPFMFAGVLASIVGSVFFSLSVLCIKLLPNQGGFSEKVKALCFRGSFVTILCGVAILVQRSTFIVRRDELFVNTLRAVFGTFGVLGLYSALSYISMGDATALIFSSPVWTSILSHFILHEPLQWLQLIALPVSLFGIVLIAHPGLIVDVEQHPGYPTNESFPQVSAINLGGTNISSLANLSTTTMVTNAFDSSSSSSLGSASIEFEHRWPGIVIALASSLLVSCVYIALKFRKTTPIQTTTFWFGAFMLLTSLALQCFTGPIDIPLTVYEWALLFSNGLFSWLGQSFLQWAFLYEEAGVLSIVRTLDVAMNFLLSALFLDEEILWTSIVGATIISLVVVSIMLNEWIKNLSCTNRKNSALQDDEQPEITFGTNKDQPSIMLNGSCKDVAKSQSNNNQSKHSAYIITPSKA